MELGNLNLTGADVARLLTDPSPDARAETAEKIVSIYTSQQLSKNERQLAEDIMRAMLQAVETQTRAALSDQVRRCASLPRDIAMSLAEDVETVALPMLRYSLALTDDDLVRTISNTASVVKQQAIAGRPRVSLQVSEALVDTGNPDVVTTLFANRGAEISEEQMHRAVNSHGADEGLQTALAKRPRIPLTVAERLVGMVSDSLRNELLTRNEISRDLVNEMVDTARERTVVANIPASGGSSEMEDLIRRLYDHNRLTPSLLLHAIYQGKVGFFEICLARLAQLSVKDTRKLLYHTDHAGLKRLYVRAGLPRGPFRAFKEAFDLVTCRVPKGAATARPVAQREAVQH